jgi:hypothetical protein
MDRLAKLSLSKWVKADLIDLLEEHPNLFDMSKEELQKIAADKYATARGYIDMANRLESDADAISKYCSVKFAPPEVPLPLLTAEEFIEKYCHNCGSQRCEGIGTEWFEGCRHRHELSKDDTKQES